MNTTLSGNCSVENETIKTIQHFKETHPIHLWSKFGLFDEDFIMEINIHWLQFLPANEKYFYILAGLYTIIMILGWSGNAFVIIMFARHASLRTSANILVLNLAISDILIMSEMPIFIINSIYRGPVLGRIACNIYGFMGGLSGTVSICILTAISLDRYYAIKYPLRMRFTNLRAKTYVGIAWLNGVIFASIPLFKTKMGSYVPEGYLTSCSFDYLSNEIDAKIFIFIFFIAAWLLPLIIIMYCYITILKTVMKTANMVKNIGIESSRHTKEEKKRQQETKLAITILLIIALWFLAWTPYAVVALLGVANRADLISPLASMVPALFCKIASCFDPFLYAITNAKFKKEVRRCFSRKVLRQRGTSIWTSQSSTRKDQTTKKSLKYTHSCHDSGDVEEIMVTFSTSKTDNEVREENVVQFSGDPKTQVEMSTFNVRPPLWYRPSFSNQTFKVGNVARRLKNRETKDYRCESCDDVPFKSTTM